MVSHGLIMMMMSCKHTFGRAIWFDMLGRKTLKDYHNDMRVTSLILLRSWEVLGGLTNLSGVGVLEMRLYYTPDLEPGEHRVHVSDCEWGWARGTA
eukprot:247254-Rhodomonas_salina.2